LRLRRPRPTGPHRRLTGALALAVLTGLVVTFLPGTPASGAGGCPVKVDRNGNCPIGHDIPLPGVTRPHQPGPTTPDDPSNPSTGTPDDGYYCEWHQYPDQERWRSLPQFSNAPEGSVFGEYHCFLDGAPIFGPYVPRFVAPGEDPAAAPPPPSPAEVAADAVLSIRALLKKPTIASYPPDPAASTIDIPTFVSIPNWQGVLTPPDHCLRGVCVSLRAEPKLTFDPGEPEAPTIACEDGGTVFDRNGADPDVQAKAPACAYEYQRRTGILRRPHAWTAEVTVTWTVSWQGPGGTGDTLDPISLSTTFDRPVEESNSVITDYSD
jgi:hypothetical protein